MTDDDLLEEPFGFSILFDSLVFGREWCLGMIDDPRDDQIRARSTFGGRRSLDDRRHQGTILVGFDLKGDGLGKHQVVVSLPPLLGFAIANLGELFQPLLDFQEDVQLDGGLFAFLRGSLDKLFRFDRKVAAIEQTLALEDDRIKEPAKRRAIALFDIIQSVVILRQVFLEFGDRVRFFALPDAHELFAGQDEVDASGVFGETCKLVRRKPRGLLVPAS